MTTKKMSYTEALTELQFILTKLESQELDVDQLSEQVRRASELIKFCKNKLHDTEEEIGKILEDMDNDQA